MEIFSEVIEKKCVKDRYPALDSDNSNCTRLCAAMSAIVLLLHASKTSLDATTSWIYLKTGCWDLHALRFVPLQQVTSQQCMYYLCAQQIFTLPEILSVGRVSAQYCCIPYIVIEIVDCNCNDLDLGRFKVIRGQRSWCQSKAHGWFPIWPPWVRHRISHRFRDTWHERYFSIRAMVRINSTPGLADTNISDFHQKQ